MSQDQDAPEFRRNLSLAACQPCRKAKIGCDHEKPCNRCVKRGLQHQCIYRTTEERPFVAPGSEETGSKPTGSLELRLKQIERSLQGLQRRLQPDSSSTPPRKRRRDGEKEISLLQRGLDDSAAGMSLDMQVEDDDAEASDLNDISIVGPNSDTRGLEEFISTREQFKDILDDLPSEHAPLQSTLPLWTSGSDERRLEQFRKELGERVLKYLPPKPFCNQLLDLYFDIFNHIRPIATRSWAKQVLEEIFQIIDGTAQAEAAVSKAVEVIESYVSKGPTILANPPSLVNWNNIGTLASMFATAAYTAPQPLDAYALRFYTQAENVQDFVFRMRKVAGMCWELRKTNEFGDESTIIQCYLYMFMLIAFGEYVPFLDHVYSCLLMASLANRLHREVAGKEHSPEYIDRRRIQYAAIYHLDKISASWRGQPPLLFRRYANTQLPSMETAENRYLRGQMLIAQAREDVLELMLTTPRGPSVEKILHTQKMILERYSSIYVDLKYNSNMPLSSSKPSVNTQRLVLYLFSLENSFLLQNVAKKRVKSFPESNLLKVSMSMFAAVVRMWEEQAEFGGFTFVLSWFLTSYAFAAGGIIYSTVLQEHSASSSETAPLRSKSHHINQLQQFLSALRSVDSNDPHFSRCKKALQIFTRVHQVLTDTVPSKPSATAPASDPHSHVPSNSASTPSTDYISEWGLNQNLGTFGALPWLDHVWADEGLGTVQMPPMSMESEQIDVVPFSADDAGVEYWDQLFRNI